MMTFCDLEMVPVVRGLGAVLGLTRVVLGTGEVAWVGEDDASLPFAEEIDDYAVSRFGEGFLQRLRDGSMLRCSWVSEQCRRIVGNYDRGILSGRECDVKLLALVEI